MIVNVKSSTGLSGFYIIFEGSTMNEKNGHKGLSHLLEHLVCKSFEHLQNVFQQKNIKWNAYTSSTEVVFFMRGLDRHINFHKKEFLDLILSYEPTQEQLDNEKKIVLEEYLCNTFHIRLDGRRHNILPHDVRHDHIGIERKQLTQCDNTSEF